MGGDVDSLAAVAAGLAAGKLGLPSIAAPRTSLREAARSGALPGWAVDELEGVEYLLASADAFQAWLDEPRAKE